MRLVSDVGGRPRSRATVRSRLRLTHSLWRLVARMALEAPLTIWSALTRTRVQRYGSISPMRIAALVRSAAFRAASLARTRPR